MADDAASSNEEIDLWCGVVVDPSRLPSSVRRPHLGKTEVAVVRRFRQTVTDAWPIGRFRAMGDSTDDPRCPECGEPIGQTATYCMHCSADLTTERAAADADGDGTWDRSNADGFQNRVAELVRDAVSATGETGRELGDERRHERRRRDETADESVVDWSTGTGTDWETGTGSGDAGGPEAGRETEQHRAGSSGSTGETDEQLLDPDGAVDDTLTIAVGIVGGVVVGVVGTIVLGAVTGSGWAIPFGLLAWLGSTAYIARRRTVQGAISLTGYATALVLLLVPVVALSPFADVENGLTGRGSLLVILLVFVAVPAGVAACVGWIAGRFRPDSSET